MRFLCTFLFAAAAVLSPVMGSATMAVGSATGFATGTTGGGSASPVYPQTIEELKKYLCSSHDSSGNCNDTTARNIILTKTFDFTGSSGKTTEWGCFVKECSSGESEYARNTSNFCSGRTETSVTFDTAGTNPLKVGSNKSILGVGTSGIMQGTGLRITGGMQNVIIQNVKFQDINYNVVFGGDAITIDNGHYVWIDHNYFQRIGRQMVVIRGGANSVTISNNVFDGRTTASAYCNGQHYWLWLIRGTDTNKITIAKNSIFNTDGRGPSIHDAVHVHVVNNLFQNVTNLGALQARHTAQVLVEGNYFNNVTYAVYEKADSCKIFAPITGYNANYTSQCSSYIGRACIENTLVDSGSKYRPVDTSVLQNFEGFSSYLTEQPMAVDLVPSTISKTAGIGVVN